MYYASCGLFPSMLYLPSWLQTQCKENTWRILVSKLLLGRVNRFVPKKNQYWRSNSAKFRIVFACVLVLNSCAQVKLIGTYWNLVVSHNTLLTLIHNFIIPICHFKHCLFSFSGRKGAWRRGPVLLSVRLCSAAGHKCQGLHWLLRRFYNGGWGYG